MNIMSTNVEKKSDGDREEETWYRNLIGMIKSNVGTPGGVEGRFRCLCRKEMNFGVTDGWIILFQP